MNRVHEEVILIFLRLESDFCGSNNLNSHMKLKNKGKFSLRKLFGNDFLCPISSFFLSFLQNSEKKGFFF